MDHQQEYLRMQMMMPQLQGGSYMAQQNSEAQFANGPNPDFTSSLGLNREAPEFNPPAGPSLMQQMPPGVMPMPMPHMRQAPPALTANNFNLMGAHPGAFAAGPNGSRASSMALVGPQAQLPPPLLGVSNASSLFAHGAPLPPNASHHMFAPGALAQMPPQLSQQHMSKQLQAHSQQFAQLPLASAFGSGGGPYSSPSSRHLPPPTLPMRNNSNELLAHGGGSEFAHLAQMPSQLPMHLAAMGLPPNNAMPGPQMGLSMANHQNALSSMLPPMDGPMGPPFSLPPGAASGALFPG